MKSVKRLTLHSMETADLKFLSEMTGLEELNLFFCDLSDDEIAELQKALPDCEIKTDTDD